MTYSIDFRKKVLLIKEKEKLSFSQIAKRFGLSVNSVFLWSKNIEPKRTRNKAPVKIHNELLLEDIQKHPDAYMYERAKRLGVSTAGICSALKRLNITYKKNSQTSQGMQRKTAIIPTKDGGI
jgi:transposase